MISDVNREGQRDEEDGLVIGYFFGDANAERGGPGEALLHCSGGGWDAKCAAVGAEVLVAFSAPFAALAWADGAGDNAPVKEGWVYAAPDGDNAGDKFGAANHGPPEAILNGGTLAIVQHIVTAQPNDEGLEEHLVRFGFAPGGNVAELKGFRRG